MARWNYRKRKSSWGRWATPLLVIGLVGVWYYAKPALEAEEWTRISYQFGICGERGRPFACVSDGDTVTLGYGKDARRIRLTGFDAPEMDGQCPAESARARVARQELQSWLNRHPFDWSGGASPPRDKYGRELREARRTAGLRPTSVFNLSDHMIDKRLASGDGPWEWRDWCD